MSWRILIKPASFDSSSDLAADWIIPLSATDQEVDDVADESAWGCRPLEILTPSKEDIRFQRLIQQFNEEHGMSEDEYTVIVKKPKEENQ